MEITSDDLGGDRREPPGNPGSLFVDWGGDRSFSFVAVVEAVEFVELFIIIVVSAVDVVRMTFLVSVSVSSGSKLLISPCV
jgi:hypothetical protein